MGRGVRPASLNHCPSLVQNIICRHGVPEELLSYRGSNFLSELMVELCSLTGMEKINKDRKLARPYHGPFRIVHLTPTNAEVQLINSFSLTVQQIQIGHQEIAHTSLPCPHHMTHSLNDAESASNLALPS